MTYLTIGGNQVILYRYDPHEELIPPEFPEGVDWRRTVEIFAEAAAAEGYVVPPEDPAHSISAIAHRKGWDLAAAMRGGGYEMRGLAPKSVLGLGPFARSFNFGRIYYKNESMPQSKGESLYRGVFIDTDVERRAQLVGHATLGVPLDRRAFARFFGADPVVMYPEEFRRLRKSGKVELGADAVSWNFSDANEANVYSKLFFSEEAFTQIEAYYGLSGADAVKQIVVTTDELPGAEWRFEICEDTGSGPAFRRAAGLKLMYQTYMDGERASLPAGGSEIADAIGAVFEMTVAEKRTKKPESVLRRIAATVRRHAKDHGGHVKCRLTDVQPGDSLNGQ